MSNSEAKAGCSGARWFVVETLPRKEGFAASNLQRQGFEFEFPKIRKVVRQARARRSELAPLFPGYLFVRFDPAVARWRSINGTLGVRRLLMGACAMPQAMPDEVMNQLLLRCVNGVLEEGSPVFAAGMQVRVLSGPLADRLATVETLDSKGRVRVLLDILGGNVRADIRAELLEAA